MTLDANKSNSSNETPNVMTVGVEKYGLTVRGTAMLANISKVAHIIELSY
jgi:hypothetical protein